MSAQIAPGGWHGYTPTEHARLIMPIDVNLFAKFPPQVFIVAVYTRNRPQQVVAGKTIERAQ